MGRKTYDGYRSVGILQRVVPHTADAFQITLDTRTPDGYTVTFVDGAVHIVAGSRVSACNAVYDYLKQICRVNLSWSGLIKEFYAVRWARFYDAAIDAAKQGKSLETEKGIKICDRPRPDATVFGKALFEFEKHWCETYSEYQEPVNRDVTDAAQALFCKYVGKDL